MRRSSSSRRSAALGQAAASALAGKPRQSLPQATRERKGKKTGLAFGANRLNVYSQMNLGVYESFNLTSNASAGLQQVRRLLGLAATRCTQRNTEGAYFRRKAPGAIIRSGPAQQAKPPAAGIEQGRHARGPAAGGARRGGDLGSHHSPLPPRRATADSLRKPGCRPREQPKPTALKLICKKTAKSYTCFYLCDWKSKHERPPKTRMWPSPDSP